MIRLASLVCVLACCLAVQAGDSKKESELKWAKGVLIDFLQSAKSQEYEQAELLMTKDLKEAMDKEVRNFLPGLRGWLGANNLESATWTISGEDVSPEKDEAKFSGLFKKDKDEAEFTFRVIKEKDSGKWRVAFVHCGKWAAVKVGPKN
jgi:hypothetical protein